MDKQVTDGRQQRKGKHLRRAYDEKRRGEFFKSKPTSDDPLENLAEFLIHLTTDGAGKPNDFLEPILIVPDFLVEWGIAFKKEVVLGELAKLYARGDATKETVLAVLKATTHRDTP